MRDTTQMSAADAIAHVGNVKDTAALTDARDADERVTVREAIDERLAELAGEAPEATFKVEPDATYSIAAPSGEVTIHTDSTGSYTTQSVDERNALAAMGLTPTKEG
jgi:hypothetical protein